MIYIPEDAVDRVTGDEHPHAGCLMTDDGEHVDEVFVVYSWGLCFASVCTNLPDGEATRRINISHPTGIDSPWTIHDEPFADGTPNPTPCPDTAGCRHVLFSC